MEPSSSTDKLEREFQKAQQFGRWLSDEEQLALEEEENQTLMMNERQRHRRVRLIVLTGICVLIPPLWGLAAALNFYLLFPETAKRFALIAGGGLVLIAILSILVIGLLLMAFLNVVF